MAAPLILKHHPGLQDQVAAVENDGYAYFPQVLDADEVAQLRQAMDELKADPAQYDRHQLPADNGFLNKSINNAFNRSLVFLPYLDRPEIIDLVEALLGNDCHCMGMTAWVTGPGRPDQTLHADWQPLTLPADIMQDPRVKIPVYITTAHFYLDDIDQEIGPTNFVPGSHRAGRRPDGATSWQGAQEHSILCQAGDCVIFRSEVWHRGTANNSDRVRYLLQVHYSQRMITQKLPPYLNRFQFAPQTLQQATPRQLRLMGDHTPSNYD
jgi:ectoine hydroxylase-related dioxygenase (phytanoyl-CoA dioxygenase family)